MRLSCAVICTISRQLCLTSRLVNYSLLVQASFASPAAALLPADAVNLLLDTAPGGDAAAWEVAKQHTAQQQGRCGDQEAVLPG